MTSAGVSIKFDSATPFIERVRTGLANRAFRPAIGEAGFKVVYEHFAAKEQEASKATQTVYGRPKLGHVGLYAQFARATNHRVTTTGVAIAVSHQAIRQRLQGGEIKPDNGRYLSIPANAEAYGKRISDFGNTLEFGAFTDEQGRTRLGWGLRDDVKQTKTVRRKGKEKQVEKVKFRAGVYFWAVRKVYQAPDPSVLPTKEALLAGIDLNVGDWLEEQTRG